MCQFTNLYIITPHHHIAGYRKPYHAVLKATHIINNNYHYYKSNIRNIVLPNNSDTLMFSIIIMKLKHILKLLLY